MGPVLRASFSVRPCAYGKAYATAAPPTERTTENGQEERSSHLHRGGSRNLAEQPRHLPRVHREQVPGREIPAVLQPFGDGRPKPIVERHDGELD